MAETGNIPDVGSWKKETDRVEINLMAAAPKDIVLKLDKDSKLSIKHSEKDLEIVVSKQKEEKTPAVDPVAQAAQGPSLQHKEGSNINGDGNKQSGNNASTKQSEEASRKQSDNVLGNVMNMLKDYKGIVITAVIAISLGFLLRRKFKAV